MVVFYAALFTFGIRKVISSPFFVLQLNLPHQMTTPCGLPRLCLVLAFAFIFFAPSSQAQLTWQPRELREMPADGDRRIHPKVAQIVEVHPEILQALLAVAPHERQVAAEQSPVLLPIPRPDGEMATFRIVAYDLSETEGMDAFPNIRTWYGVNMDGSGQSIFLDWTDFGFHASIRYGSQAAFFIDPLFRGSRQWYQSYFVADAGASAFECATLADNLLPDDNTPHSGQGRSVLAGDCNLRSYRTAIAATGEYSNYFGATNSSQASLVQSAMVTTVNRVNQVFTRELQLRLLLVSNNASLYYYNPTTDPYTGTSPGALLDENTPNLNAVIGSSSYDLGHVFSAGFSSGVAYLRSSCGGSKGGGVTGRSTPEGDPFDIDYVAHEMGHQLGGNHTQNNSCNYSSSAGMEPGSASTIMGYAGICSPNVQSFSDAYFHGRSIAEITNHVELGNGNGCAAIVSMALSNPSVVAQQDKSIPHSTPFRLVGNVSGNGSLNYGWEQYDVAQATMPPVATNTTGPMFRSFFPTAAADRYFPKLSDIVTGFNSTWEVLPSLSRQLNFRLTVRNFNATYGCAGEDDLRLTVDGTKGPFIVTDPAQNNQLSAGQVAQVQWEVAGTNQAPINSQLVEILLSTDGGQTFSLLASNEPNDGLATVSLPNQITNSARIMVRSQDNVFLNVGSQSFQIVSSAGTAAFGLSNMGSSSVADCFVSDGNTRFNFLTSSAGGATAPITFSVSNLPAGATATFYPNPVQPGGTTQLTVNNLDQIAVGLYNLTIQASSAEDSENTQVQIEKTGGSGGAGPALVAPNVGAIGLDLRPTLSVAPSGTGDYTFQVSDDPSFANLVINVTTANTSFTLPSYLDGATTYYWRSRSTSASCGVTNWTTGDFTTGDCYIYSSTSNPLPISAGPPTVVVEMPLEVPDMGTVQDVDIYQLDLDHTYLGDLEIRLLTPDGTSRRFFNRSCGGNDNILTSFDDESPFSMPCPPVSAAAFVAPPGQSLSGLDGRQVNGTWRLRVSDLANQDGGSLNSFSLKICINEYTQLPVRWLSFTVRPQGEQLVLDWETAEEQNNVGFYIERSSASGRDAQWENIGFVAANGTERGGRYSFVDTEVLKGITYFYRLRQEDADGSFEYSVIRSGRLMGEGASLVLFPNPTSDWLQYRLVEGAVMPATYELYDLGGRLLLAGKLEAQGGQLALTALADGIYVLRLADGSVARVVKQRP